MSFDIYGNPLRHGHCEVHPSVHEEYPCSVCLAEKRQRVSQVPQCDICGLYDAVADSHGFYVCSQECCDEATCRATTKKSSDAEIARLRAKLAECERDAKRYRLLRAAPRGIEVQVLADDGETWCAAKGAELDAAIDEAMKEG